VVVVVDFTQVAQLEQVAQAEAVQEVLILRLHLEQPTEVAVEAVAVAVQYLLVQVALAAQALSSFPTQAQHNYSVVELLPNQAVTSFTHSHLLALLALCHL
jgi:hypothetical protein